MLDGIFTGSNAACCNEMRLSAARLLKLLLATWLVAYAVYRKNAVCKQDPQPATRSTADERPSTSVLNDLINKEKQLQTTLLQRRKQISQLEAEIESLRQSGAAGDTRHGRGNWGLPAAKQSASRSAQQFTQMDEVVPVNEYDVVPWQAFTLDEEFRTDIGVARKTGGALHPTRKEEINLVVDTALKSLPATFSRKNFVDGLQRTYRDLGIQYQLYFQNPDDANEIRHVQVMRALEQLSPARSPPVMSIEQLQVPGRGLEVIVPVTGRLKHTAEFLDAFLESVLHVKPGSKYTSVTPAVKLTFVAMISTPDILQQLEQLVQTRCTQVGYKSARVVKETTMPASTSSWRSAMQTALHSRGNDKGDIVVILDIDHRLNSEVLRRCVGVALKGKRVYWPIPFQFYNPHLVLEKVPVAPEKVMKINGQHGFWSAGRYTAACIER